MLRKTSCGYVEFKELSRREEHNIDFDSCKDLPETTMYELEQQLDSLLKRKNELALIQDDYELDKQFKIFLDDQYKVIETLSPLLDRLANLGAFHCEYDKDVGSPEFHRRLDFWSESGYAIVRGYTIYGSSLDGVSDPPPPLEGIKDGGFLLGPHNWILAEGICPHCQSVKEMKIQTQLCSSFDGDESGPFCQRTYRLGEKMPWFENDRWWMNRAFSCPDEEIQSECCSSWCQKCGKEFFAILNFQDKTPIKVQETGLLENWPEDVTYWERGNE